MRRRFKRKKRSHEEVALQITSLADILIIVLIFLLKSYSSGLDTVEDITYHEGIQMPLVSKGKRADKGLTIEIARDQVWVGGKLGATLNDYRFPKKDLNKDLTENGTSKSLIRSISREKSRASKEEKKRVWLVSDRAAPYVTIQTVLASAAVNGYSDIKLLVIKED